MGLENIFKLRKKGGNEEPKIVDRKITSEAIHQAGDVVLPPEAFGSEVNQQTGLVEERKTPQEKAERLENIDRNNP